MKLILCVAALFLAISPSLLASPIPYPNAGQIAPQTATYATGSGGISVYFAGSSASFTDFIEVFDIQTGFNSGQFFDNQTTPLGTQLLIGTGSGQIDAGDQLVFYIDSPEGIFASDATYSSDSINHTYIGSFGGGPIGSANVPSGFYLGFEDEANGQSDLDYNDAAIVATGVTNISPTPEPSSLLLLGTGIATMAGLIRRKYVRR